MEPDEAAEPEDLYSGPQKPLFLQRLAFLFVAYGLTTVVGGFLAFFFQEQSRRNQLEASTFASQKQEALELYQGIAELIGRRHYLMLRIYFGSKSDPLPEDYEERWEKYVEILHEWNSGTWNRRALLKAYFGEEMKESFRAIHYQFRDIGLLLEQGKREGKFSPDLLDEINLEMDEVTEMFKAYNEQSLDAILDGKIGSFRKASNTIPPSEAVSEAAAAEESEAN